MQSIPHAVAVFCIACIGAELLVCLTERGWARTCIKAVAGVYILLAFFHTFPSLRAVTQKLTLPEPSVISFGTLEDTVLSETAAELERTLEAQCRTRFGKDATLTVELQSTTSGWTAGTVRCSVASDCGEAEKAEIRDFLQEQLGVLPEMVTETMGAEEEP